MKCPICGKVYKTKSYSEDGYEIGYVSCCPRCDYREEESFGANMVSFCGNHWQWGYGTPEHKIAKIEKEIADAISKNAKHPQFPHRKYEYYKINKEYIPF